MKAMVTGGTGFLAGHLMDRLLADGHQVWTLDLPGPRGTLTCPVAYALGTAMEAAWTFLRLKGEPTLTSYTAAELAKNHSYSIARARKDMGYEPKVGVEEGLEKTFAWIDENGIPEYK